MNRGRIRAYAPVIYSALSAPNQDQRNVLFSNLSDPAFDFMCDCLNRVVFEPEKLHLKSNQITNLQGHLAKEKKNIVYLAKKGGNRKRKRKIVATQSGAGIGIALATLLPIIISTVKSIIQKHKKK